MKIEDFTKNSCSNQKIVFLGEASLYSPQTLLEITSPLIFEHGYESKFSLLLPENIFIKKYEF